MSYVCLIVQGLFFLAESFFNQVKMKYNLMQHDWLNGVVIPGLKHSDKRNQLTIHRMTVTGPYNARSSQSIKIAIDLSIDKSIAIRIDQSVEIDDTLLSFIDLSRF